MERIIKTKIRTNEERKQRKRLEINNRSKWGNYFIIEKRYKTGRRKQFIVRNLKMWCEQNGILYHSLYKTIYDGSWIFHHRVISRNVYVSDGVVK